MDYEKSICYGFETAIHFSESQVSTAAIKATIEMKTVP